MFPQGILGIEGGGPAAITGRSGKFSLSSEIQLFFALRGFEQKMRLARDTARRPSGLRGYTSPHSGAGREAFGALWNKQGTIRLIWCGLSPQPQPCRLFTPFIFSRAAGL